MKMLGKSADGRTVTLHNIENCKFQLPSYATAKWIDENPNLIRNGIALDVETTGLIPSVDKIIELGLRQFKFNRETGEILALGEAYSGFEDPKIPLLEEIKKLTGINDEMLKDKLINWPLVEKYFLDAHIIIAHNASFDRSFVDKKIPESAEKIWACSLRQINWTQKGFTIHKLEILGILHGFFIDNAHRALHDTDALLYLINLQDETTQSPYLKELITNARRLTVTVKANNSPFESKDNLKKRGYFWDGSNKCWFKSIYKDEIDAEVIWLEKDVYKGAFAGSMQEVKLVDNFKAS